MSARGEGAASEPDVCRQVAFRAARKNSPATVGVLAVAEDLLAKEENYDFVMSFLEDLQNLVSHGLDALIAPDQVMALLGPRSLVCWTTLADFWAAVAAWRTRTGMAAGSSYDLPAIENQELRTLMWTGIRTLPTGEQVGLDHAILYEKAGQPPLPGYSHIAAALDARPHP
jgi:hypothetical protein